MNFLFNATFNFRKQLCNQVSIPLLHNSMIETNKQAIIYQSDDVIIPEQLILQAWLGDSEVDDCYLDAYFWQIVRVRQFSCHVEPSRRRRQHSYKCMSLYIFDLFYKRKRWTLSAMRLATRASYCILCLARKIVATSHLLLTKSIQSTWLDIEVHLFARVYGPQLNLGAWTRKKWSWPSHLDLTFRKQPIYSFFLFSRLNVIYVHTILHVV